MPQNTVGAGWPIAEFPVRRWDMAIAAVSARRLPTTSKPSGDDDATSGLFLNPPVGRWRGSQLSVGGSRVHGALCIQNLGTRKAPTDEGVKPLETRIRSPSATSGKLPQLRQSAPPLLIGHSPPCLRDAAPRFPPGAYLRLRSSWPREADFQLRGQALSRPLQPS